jgi:hypothetical protein
MSDKAAEIQNCFLCPGFGMQADPSEDCGSTSFASPLDFACVPKTLEPLLRLVDIESGDCWYRRTRSCAVCGV